MDLIVCSQVLIYSGQLDVIVAAPLTERFLPTVNWSKADEYKKAERFHWKVQPSDTEVAGYVRQVGEFFQVRVCSTARLIFNFSANIVSNLEMIIISRKLHPFWLHLVNVLFK